MFEPENSLKLACTGVLLVGLLLPGMAAAQISKCQDANGKWHYGDNAAAACGDAKITVFDKKGIKVDEIDSPPTAAEVEARRAAKERQKRENQLEKEREEARKRILRVYPDEASILRARDQRIAGIDKQIKLDETLLDDLRLEMNQLESRKPPTDKKAKQNYQKRKQSLQQQIDDYNNALRQLRRNREATNSKYQVILEEFWDLTGDPRASRSQ